MAREIDGGATGVRTFLIADLRGYTRFTQEHGDEAAAAIAASFAALVRSTVRDFDGSLIELRGDEALAAFPSARQALRAAVDLQRGSRQQEGDRHPLPLGLGIGLDSGEAVPTEGGYRGGALNLASRLCSLAGPGQVLASEGVIHLARHVPGLRFGEPRSVRAKGIAGRVRAVEVLPEVPLPPLPAAERPPRRRLVFGGVLLAAGLTAAVAAGLVFALTRDGEGSSAIAANTTALVNGSGGSVEAEVPVGGRPGGVAVGAGAVWVTDAVGGTVLRIDREKHLVVDRIEVGRGPEAVVVGGRSVWVANSQDGTVSEINPESGTVVGQTRVGNGPTGLAFVRRAVWAVNELDATLSRISTATGEVVATVPLGQNPSGITAGLGAVWVTSEEAGVLIRVDPGSNAVTQTIPVGNGPLGAAVGRGGVWVANPPDRTVSRVDPRTGGVSKITVDGAPTQLSFTDEGLWSASTLDGKLALIDPQEQRVRHVVDVQSDPQALAGDGDELWVATLASRESHRGGTLRVLSEGGDLFDTIDPGLSFRGQAWQALSIVYDGLVTFRRAAGPLGASVVPDLATRLPIPQDGGRTYTFQLREGIRFSNGRLVEPADVRSSAERQFRAGTGLSEFGIPLAGADRCSPERCDLSEAITVDEAARTVTFHLTEPDPDFLFKLALPFGAVVPDGSGKPDFGRPPLPGTGPYRIERYVPNRTLVLARNPNFREWSAQAQPAGFPDRIVWTFDVGPERATTDVERGRADVMLGAPPEGRLSEISRLFANQAHPFIRPETHYAFLNTRLPPFDDARIRRALNYAADRAEIARLWGGPELAHVTCQVLPPGFPGYRPYCPYTAGDDRSGIWNAPDLRRARQLLAPTDAQGSAVTVAVNADDPTKLATARYFVRLLGRLGFRPSLRTYPDIQTFYEQAGKPKARVQLGIQGWTSDFPRASDFFLSLLTCSSYQPAAPVNVNAAGFCSASVDRTAERAHALEATDPAAAGPLWVRADREVVDAAPWVSFLNVAGVDLVSDRVGNYQRSLQLGILLDQLWVR